MTRAFYGPFFKHLDYYTHKTKSQKFKKLTKQQKKKISSNLEERRLKGLSIRYLTKMYTIMIKIFVILVYLLVAVKKIQINRDDTIDHKVKSNGQ